AGGFFQGLGTSFANGRAWDSVQGQLIGMADYGADFAVDSFNSFARLEFSVLNGITGQEKQWDDYESPSSLRDYVSPLYGHTQDSRQGQVVAQYTVHAQVRAAQAWGAARLMTAVPGMAGTAIDAGAAGFGVTGAGELVVVPSVSGGLITVGAHAG